MSRIISNLGLNPILILGNRPFSQNLGRFEAKFIDFGAIFGFWGAKLVIIRHFCHFSFADRTFPPRGNFEIIMGFFGVF